MSFSSYYRWLAALPALALFCAEAGADGPSQAIQQNIDDLIRTNSCVGCDLRGADLNRMILVEADLSHADLSGATFFLADLSGANLSGANLRDAKFGGADLAGADLRGADLRGALLDGAFLKGSLMDGKVVEVTAQDFDNEVDTTEKVYVPDQSEPKDINEQNRAALSGNSSELEGASSSTTVVDQDEKPPAPTEAKETEDEVGTFAAAPAATAERQARNGLEEEPKELKDQKKSEATAEQVKLESTAVASQPKQAPPVKTASPVQEAQVEGSPRTILQTDETTPISEEEPLVGDDMAEKELVQEGTTESAAATSAAVVELVEKMLDTNRCYECNLAGVDLTGEDLSGSDLEGSDLSGALLNDTDLAGTNLKGVSLRGAQMRNADLRRADLYKADLSGADLTDADFRGALIDDANFSGAIGYQPPLMVE